MRIDLDTERERHRIPVRNLLWDCKKGKPSGQWRIIRSERDIENYIDASKPQDIYAHRAYNYLCPHGQGKHMDLNGWVTKCETCKTAAYNIGLGARSLCGGCDGDKILIEYRRGFPTGRERKL
jgi:hypothetical protein